MIVLASHYNAYFWQLIVRIDPLGSGNTNTVYCRVDGLHVYHNADNFEIIDKEKPHAQMASLADGVDTVVIAAANGLTVLVRHLEIYNARNIALRVRVFLKTTEASPRQIQLTDYTLSPNKTLFYHDGRFWSDTDLRDTALIVAISDETSNLSVGTGKLLFRMPYAFYLTNLRASVNVAPAGAALRFDVKASGTSILASALQIDAGHKTSVTSSSPVSIARSSLNDDEEIQIDITQVGTTTPGKGAKLYFIGHIIP